MEQEGWGNRSKDYNFELPGIWNFCSKKHTTLQELPLRWENNKGDKMTQEVNLPLILSPGTFSGQRDQVILSSHLSSSNCHRNRCNHVTKFWSMIYE